MLPDLISNASAQVHGRLNLVKGLFGSGGPFAAFGSGLDIQSGKFFGRPLKIDVIQVVPEQIVGAPVRDAGPRQFVHEVSHQPDSHVGFGLRDGEVDFQFFDTAFHGCPFASFVGLDSHLDPASGAKGRPALAAGAA